jgi:hypothetical protein
VVVRQDRRPQTVRLGQVPAARAQVPGGGQGGVLDVLGVGDSVPVSIPAVPRPRRGDELHRSDGPVPGAAAVPPPRVGVGDAGVRPAIEDRSVHRGDGPVLLVEAAPSQGARLDLADGGQQPRVEVAGGGHRRGGPGVRRPQRCRHGERPGIGRRRGHGSHRGRGRRVGDGGQRHGIHLPDPVPAAVTLLGIVVPAQGVGGRRGPDLGRRSRLRSLRALEGWVDGNARDPDQGNHCKRQAAPRGEQPTGRRQVDDARRTWAISPVHAVRLAHSTTPALVEARRSGLPPTMPLAGAFGHPPTS